KAWQLLKAGDVKQAELLLQNALAPRKRGKSGAPIINDPLEIIEVLVRVIIQDLGYSRQRALRELVSRANLKASPKEIHADTERLRSKLKKFGYPLKHIDLQSYRLELRKRLHFDAVVKKGAPSSAPLAAPLSRHLLVAAEAGFTLLWENGEWK